MLKFFGMADLGMVQQQNGALSSYAGEPLSIVGDNSEVCCFPVNLELNFLCQFP